MGKTYGGDLIVTRRNGQDIIETWFRDPKDSTSSLVTVVVDGVWMDTFCEWDCRVPTWLAARIANAVEDALRSVVVATAQAT